jgi:hypothetical protein
LEGVVLTTGAEGLVGADSVRVVFDPCSDTLAECRSPGNQPWTDTGPDGRFTLVFYTLFWGARGFVTAEVDGIALRALSQGPPELITIDPISEAAVQLLEARGLDKYDVYGAGTVVEAVRDANAQTSFAGLSVDAAVALARMVASADPAVLEALDESILPPTLTPTPVTPSRTPTITKTPTPTVTLTRLPTATPRAVCPGDCSGDGLVTVDEIVVAVNIALGTFPLGECPAYAGMPGIADLVKAVVSSLEGCPPLVALPDLVPISGRLKSPLGCMGAESATVEVCVANVGDAAAGPFVVVLNAGADEYEVPGLAAGEGWCGTGPLLLFPLGVAVDPAGAVVESRKDNNQATFQGDPWMVHTCTPTATPSPTPT